MFVKLLLYRWHGFRGMWRPELDRSVGRIGGWGSTGSKYITLQNNRVHHVDWSVRANIVYRRSYSRPE